MQQFDFKRVYNRKMFVKLKVTYWQQLSSSFCISYHCKIAVKLSSGVHRPPEGQGQNGVSRAQSRGVGVVVPPRLGVSRFMILSRFFVMLVFLFCKLFEQYSQTYFSIIKTKPFKVTKYKQKFKKYGRYLGQSG